MSKYVRVAIVPVMILSCLVSWGNALAQSSRGRKELSVEKLVKRFPLETGRALTVIVNNIGENGVVCAEATNNTNDIQLQACSIHYNENIEAKIEWLKIEKFKALSEDEVIFSNNTLTIDGHATPVKRVVIHLSLPPQTGFLLYVNGKQVDSNPLSGNIMIQSGKPVLNPVVGPDNYSFEAAILQASRLTGLKR